MNRMPAEFELHKHTWVLWPERPDNWRDHAEPAQTAMQLLIAAIAQFEPVIIGANLNSVERVRRRTSALYKVVAVAYDDTWIRDTGPTCVVTREDALVGLDWRFNSWGGLFESWEYDDDVARQVLQIEGLQRIKMNLVLEGGAISVDGEGSLLTTEECLLNRYGNVGVSKHLYEDIFLEHFGITKTLWLPFGILGDETGGHVDNIAGFVAPGHIVVAWTDDQSHPQYERCKVTYKFLCSAKDAQGRTLKITKLPLPSPMYMSRAESEGFEPTAGSISRKAGDQLPASYVNLYCVNDGIILPSFGCPTDEIALKILQRQMPDRRIVSVPSREFLLGGGGPHCLTQQIPLGPKPLILKT